jgi:hypothetical protein
MTREKTELIVKEDRHAGERTTMGCGCGRVCGHACGHGVGVGMVVGMGVGMVKEKIPPRGWSQSQCLEVC